MFHGQDPHLITTVHERWGNKPATQAHACIPVAISHYCWYCYKKGSLLLRVEHREESKRAAGREEPGAEAAVEVDMILELTGHCENKVTYELLFTPQRLVVIVPSHWIHGELVGDWKPQARYLGISLGFNFIIGPPYVCNSTLAFFSC